MRYLRLYLYFVQFSMSRAMAFRFDFWFRIIMDSIYYLIAIATFRTIYMHTSTLGGFSMDEAMVFVAGTFIIDAVSMTFYTAGTWLLPSMVNKGDLDYYLVRPVSSLFFISFREFAIASCVNLFMAVGILVWTLQICPAAIPVWKIIYGTILLINGSLLFYFLRVIMLCPTFWTTSGEGLQHIFYYLREAMERPDGIFTGATRILFLTVLPFALMASFPTRAFFEEFNPYRLLHIIAVTLGLFFVMVWIWKKGLRAYSSASS